MNEVNVAAADFPLPRWERRLADFALAVLEKLGRDGLEVSLLLCGDATMSGLNRYYRGKEGATDVLAFAQREGSQIPAGSGGLVPAGDIAISLDTLETNARLFAVDIDEELRRLVIHGILHLDGMDHLGNEEAEPMLRLQESILEELDSWRILPARGNA